MTEEGGIAHTIKLCKQCHIGRRLKQCEQPSEGRAVEMMDQKAFRGKLWKASGMEQYQRRVWVHFTVKRKWAKEVLADAGEERPEGSQGNGQMESLLKEELKLVTHSNDFVRQCIF